jgi:hypothetical protein
MADETEFQKVGLNWQGNNEQIRQDLVDSKVTALSRCPKSMDI